MHIRNYAPTDRDACLEVFHSSTPDLLTADSLPQFAVFLDSDPTSFFVAENEGEIVGCGGFAVRGDTGRLEWGLVRRKFQRMGIGRFLLFYRLREITRSGEVQFVGLDCPRLAAPFYVSQGFREVSGDSERAEMVKRLAVCA